MLNVGTSGGDWSAPHFGRRIPSTHRTGGYVGPRTGALDALATRKISGPSLGFKR